MKTNHFKTILIAIAMITGLSAATTAQDKTPPKLPDIKTVTITDITSTGCKVTWNKATDETTAQKDLKYIVSVYDGHGYDYLYGEISMKDINTHTFINLPSGVYCMCIVEVIDIAGNRSRYTIAYFTTLPAPDVTSPVVSNPDIRVGIVTAYEIPIQWTKATDPGGSAPEKLRYEMRLRVGSSWAVIATLTDASSYTFTGLTPETTYEFDIIVYDEAGNLKRYDSKTVTTISAHISVESINLMIGSMTLEVGQTYSLHYTISPPEAANKSVTWHSSNPGVATVESVGEAGVVTARAAGVTTITVSSNENSSIKTSCTITVTSADVPVTGISVSPKELSLDVGKTGNIFFSIDPPTATNKAVTWMSSNDAIATVNASGMVTAKAEGIAVIAVTTVDGGHMAMCEVTVKSPVDNGTIAGNIFNVYPNPTDGEVTIEGLTPGGIVKLYSPTGSLIASYTAHDSVLKIDLTSFKQGLYLLNYEGKTLKVIRK